MKNFCVAFLMLCHANTNLGCKTAEDFVNNFPLFETWNKIEQYIQKFNIDATMVNTPHPSTGATLLEQVILVPEDPTNKKIPNLNNMSGCENNRKKIAQLLIKLGANVNPMTSNKQKSLLGFSLEKEAFDIAAVLIANDASLTKQEKKKYSEQVSEIKKQLEQPAKKSPIIPRYPYLDRPITKGNK